MKCSNLADGLSTDAISWPSKMNPDLPVDEVEIVTQSRCDESGREQALWALDKPVLEVSLEASRAAVPI